MYKLQNGWTKEQMIEAIRLGNYNRKSTNKGTCKYVAADGNKCFVGCFIPDDVYAPSAEGNDAMGLLNCFPGLAAYMPLDLDGLTELQQVHDLPEARDDTRSLHEQAEEWIHENVEGRA